VSLLFADIQKTNIICCQRVPFFLSRISSFLLLLFALCLWFVFAIHSVSVDMDDQYSYLAGILAGVAKDEHALPLPDGKTTESVPQLDAVTLSIAEYLCLKEFVRSPALETWNVLSKMRARLSSTEQQTQARMPLPLPVAMQERSQATQQVILEAVQNPGSASDPVCGACMHLTRVAGSATLANCTPADNSHQKMPSSLPMQTEFLPCENKTDVESPSEHASSDKQFILHLFNLLAQRLEQTQKSVITNKVETCSPTTDSTAVEHLMPILHQRLPTISSDIEHDVRALPAVGEAISQLPQTVQEIQDRHILVYYVEIADQMDVEMKLAQSNSCSAGSFTTLALVMEYFSRPVCKRSMFLAEEFVYHQLPREMFVVRWASTFVSSESNLELVCGAFVWSGVEAMFQLLEAMRRKLLEVKIINQRRIVWDKKAQFRPLVHFFFLFHFFFHLVHISGSNFFFLFSFVFL
jgi:hypothetical protein